MASGRQREDMGLLNVSYPTGGVGVEGIVNHFVDGTDEIKNLLRNECNIIFECRACMNLFRSEINFLTHKRSVCRSQCRPVSEEISNAMNDFATSSMAGENGNGNGNAKRTKGGLRKRSLMKLLEKRTQHYTFDLPVAGESVELHTLPKFYRDVPLTTFRDGQQVMESFTHGLIRNLPEDEVCVVIPQGFNNLYRDMSLRARKKAQVEGAARKVAVNDLPLVDRLMAVQFVDLQSLTCAHSDCKEKLPFTSWQTLAYHVTVKHNRRVDGEIPCLICDYKSAEFKALMAHMQETHEHYHKEHVDARTTAPEERSEKRGRKPKVPKQPIISKRGHSLSPDPDDFVDSECSDVVSDDNDTGSRITEPKMNEVTRPEKVASSKEGSQSVASAQINGSGTEKSLCEEVDKALEHHWAVKNRVDFAVAMTCNEYARALALDNVQFTKDVPSEIASSKRSGEAAQTVDSAKEKTVSKESSPPMSPKKPKSDIQPTRVKSKKLQKGRKPKTPSPNVNDKTDSKEGSNEDNKKADNDIQILDEEKEHEETRMPKKRGPKGKRKLQLDEVENEEIKSGNVDDQDSMFGRRSRLRRKPHYIRTNYFTEFDRKRPRDINDDSEIPAKRPSPENQPSPSPEVSVTPESNEIIEQAESGGDKKESDVVEDSKTSCDKIGSSLPVPNEENIHAPEDDSVNDTASGNRSIPNVVDAVHPEDDSVVTLNRKDVLPRVDVTPAQFTPRARRLNFGIPVDGHNEAMSLDLSQPSTSVGGSSRRKQNLSTYTEGDDITIVRYANGQPPPRVRNLADVPVYLTETQRQLFFSFICPAIPGKSGSQAEHKCMQCGMIVPTLEAGRRHAVSHLRVMRLRCALCHCGSFFCSDMRTHLMYRHCEFIHLAKPGRDLPCMTAAEADDLTIIVDSQKPGRVLYTSGKIVSACSHIPYYPDPEIEKRVLGNALPNLYRNSEGNENGEPTVEGEDNQVNKEHDASKS